MSLRRTYKTDKLAEVKGVRVVVGINEFNKGEMAITLSRMSRSNTAYTTAMEAATRDHAGDIAAGTMDEKLADDLMRGVFADVILLGWENIPLFDITGEEADKGSVAEFTKANALKLFDELPDVYDNWEGRAKKASTFREVAREKNAKN